MIYYKISTHRHKKIHNNQLCTDRIVDYYMNNDCNSLMQLGVLNGGKRKYNILSY